MFENLQGSRREDTRNQSENSSDHTGWEGRNEKDTQFFATQSVAEIVREREIQKKNTMLILMMQAFLD